MGRLIDISGMRFGKWVVIGSTPELRALQKYKRSTMWMCRCDCGTERTVEASSLRDGQSVNCGCEHRGRTHRASGTPEYNSWNSMHQRCRSKPEYQGVSISSRWCGSPDGFINFLNDMGPRPPGSTLDRIENSKGYEPGNCRWATPLTQTMNRSNARNVMLDGELMTFQVAESIMRKEMQAGLSFFNITRSHVELKQP